MGLSVEPQTRFEPVPLVATFNAPPPSLLAKNTFSFRPAVFEGAVTWLPQVHWNEVVDSESPESQGVVLEKQFKIAKYLLAHKDHLVLTEGLAYILKREGNNVHMILPPFVQRDELLERELNAEQIKHHMDQIYARTCFSRGIPQDIAHFTPEQRSVLERVGAALTLFYLGEFDTLYPTTYPQFERRVVSAFLRLREAHKDGTLAKEWESRETQTLLFEEREATLSQLLTLAKEDGGRKNKGIIYIFGAHHAPPSTHDVVVPPEFESDIGGKVLEAHRERKIRIFGASLTGAGLGVLAFIALMKRRNDSPKPQQ